MSVVDRALLRVAPEWAERRALARLRTETLNDARELVTRADSNSGMQRSDTRWRGASRVLRSLQSWMPRLGSGRSDLPLTERKTLVSRSHDAYRNHLIARAAASRVRTNVIGTGLIMHPSVNADVLGITEEQADDLNRLISTHWSVWAEDPTECDVEATLDFYGLQSLVEISTLLSGDVFALTPFKPRRNGVFGLKVQLVDGARVSTPAGRMESATLVEGIEMDVDGRPHTYHICRRHPDDLYPGAPDVWDPMPVFGAATGRRRALHIWNDKDRVGMVRGVPYLAPIIEPLQTLEQYSRAELVAAVVSALFTVFLEKGESPFDATGARTSAFENETESAAGTTGNLELGNGAIVDLAPGEKATMVNPSRPNANYDPFFLSVCKQIGAALELPVDELLLNYQASYSAARAAMLQAWRFYTTRRWSRVQQFCAPTYGLWFDEAVARGIIPVTDYADPIRRAAYTRAIWVGPARGSMDEQKEAGAAKLRIDMGVSNEMTETAAMMGEDWAGVYAQRLREVNRRKADGMWPAAPKPEATAPKPGESTTPPEDDSTQDPAKRGVPSSGDQE
jgi:lambda family phage portal protein